MSVVMSLFVNRSRMPSPADWARAIRSSGFELELDSDFDPESFSGFLPCKYGGADAGFEYFREAVNRDELPDHVSVHVAERDTMINFVTHSDLAELATSTIAGAVLCSISDGVLWDTEADELVPATGALAWARKGEATIKAALLASRPKRR
jgi:hypothetical protein